MHGSSAHTTRRATTPLPRRERTYPDDRIERSGPRAWPDASIAGVDEVGRGPLAGPVTAAAVILDPNDVPEGLDDSKRLTAARRVALHDAIVRRALAVSVASLPAPAIDTLNIRAASLEAMRRAVLALAVRPNRVLVDGRDRPPDLPCPSDPIIGGDAQSVSIAAASIIAKVVRDRMMMRAHERWPAYGFGDHKGYPTVAHRRAIAEHGPCALHRRSFGALRRLEAVATPHTQG